MSLATCNRNGRAKTAGLTARPAKFALIALLALSVAVPGRAQTALDEPGLSDAAIEQRLRFLEDRLEGPKTHARVWWYSWLTINAGSMVGLGTAAALTDNDGDRVKNIVKAVTSGIGLSYMLATPLQARLGASPVADMPERTRAQKLAKLRAAEHQLRHNAKRAERRWGLLEHVGNAALNVAAGTATALASKPEEGVDVAVTGFLGGLVFLLTQPSKPAKDWKDYQNLGRPKTTRVDVFVNPLPGGGSLNVRIQW